MNRRQPNRWDRNKRHWEETLDAQNLGRDSGAGDLARQLALFETADVRMAIGAMEPLQGKLVLDLGGGLGLMAVLLARCGAQVVVADLSLPRLKLARSIAESAGVAQQIHFVACKAEQLPFAARAFDRQTTKSVLIHTDLPVAATELARTLAPGGCSLFIEPLNRHPLVNLYRRLAAPKIWQAITDYFTEDSIVTLQAAYRRAGFAAKVRHAYLTAFCASPLNYALPTPRLYKILERTLLGLDNLILKAAPSLRRNCWFALIKFEQKSGRTEDQT